MMNAALMAYAAGAGYWFACGERALEEHGHWPPRKPRHWGNLCTVVIFSLAWPLTTVAFLHWYFTKYRKLRAPTPVREY